MSEVADATQILVVVGRAIYKLGEIDLKLAMQIIKLINTAYLAKWKGKAGLGRLRQIKGDDLMYLNVGSEDKTDLKRIQREMKDHGILFAKMPDLCGGDGRTQYAVAVSDAPKVRALLIDHPQGKNRDISIGMLSEKEYFSTAFDKDGKPTPEMWDLAHRQQEPAYGAAEPGRVWSAGGSRQTAKEQETGRSAQSGTERSQQRGFGLWESSNRQQNPAHSWQYGSPEQQVGSLQRTFSDVKVRMRDLDSRGLQSLYQWLPGPPIDVQKRFAEFTLDGTHSVFVPIEDAVIPTKKNGAIDMSGVGAALFQDKSYTVADRQNATFHSMTGAAVLSAVRQAILEQKMQGGAGLQQTLDRTQNIPPQMSGGSQEPSIGGGIQTGLGGAGSTGTPESGIPLAQSGVKPAVPKGVILNGVPGAQSLDAPAGRSLDIPAGKSL